MFKSGDLPLSLTLISGVDLDGDISVAPRKRVRIIVVAVG